MRPLRRQARSTRWLACAIGVALQVLLALPATAQKPATPAATTEASGPAWSTLTPAQKATLAPLQRDWSGIDSLGKKKWLELAEKYQSMPPADRQRVQERMTEWSRLTPDERSRARSQYQQARQMPTQDKQMQWDAYQALPADEKRALANRSDADRETASPKRGQIPATGSAATPASAAALAAANRSAPKTVAPAVVQAKPGASTTLISNTPAPPPSAQPQKIVAPPGQVNRSTLLPKSDRPEPAAGGTPASAARSRP